MEGKFVMLADLQWHADAPNADNFQKDFSNEN